MNANDAITVDALSGTVDADALVADLFATEGRSLVRLASIFCDDRASAEDLVQEAFIRLHRSASSIRDRGRAPAFLRSIVINLARDHNRRGLMSTRHMSTLRREPRPQPSTEERAADHDDDRRLLEHVRLLPERQRACVVLRYYLQYTEAETAETLGISKSSVKTHCRRALAHLETTVGSER